MTHLHPYLLYILSFVGALLISLLTVPQVIAVAGKKNLFDLPDERKHHKNIIPSLGGIAIFFAYIIVISIIVQPIIFDKWHYVVAASLLFFLTGLMDDIAALTPVKKLTAQLIPVFIITVLADIRIHSFYGMGHIWELPYLASIALTGFFYLFFTNAFNLIDGIDGYAGATGILYTALLGLLLAASGYIGAACMAFSLMGATAGFLRYNITPARLFMGDTGSLLLGFTISVLTVLFINSYNPATFSNSIVHKPAAAFIISLGILSLPLMDCIRVFVLRMRAEQSPFKADRRHLHHYLLDAGFTQLQATGISLLANCIIVVISFFLQSIPTTLAIVTMIAVIAAFFALVHYLRNRKMKRVS